MDPWTPREGDVIAFSANGRDALSNMWAKLPHLNVGKGETHVMITTTQPLTLYASGLGKPTDISYYAVYDEGYQRRTEWTKFRGARMWDGDSITFNPGDLQFVMTLEDYRWSNRDRGGMFQWDDLPAKEKISLWKKYQDKFEREKIELEHANEEILKSIEFSKQFLNEEIPNGVQSVTKGDVTWSRVPGPVHGMTSKEEKKILAQIRDGFVDLRELQLQHGLEGDGLMGPQTIRMLKSIASKRALVAQRVTQNAFASTLSELSVTPCKAKTRFKYKNKYYDRTCESVEPNHAVHHATFRGATSSWDRGRRGTLTKISDAMDQKWLESQAEIATGRTRTTNAAALARESSVLPVINRPESFVMYADDGIIKTSPGGIGYIESKPAEPEKPHEPMTYQEYSDRFDKLTFALHRDKKNPGWHVYVDLADQSGQWQYWRPFRIWAERVGTKRLLEEVERLERLYQADHPEVFTVAKLGVSREKAVPTTDELTEILRQDEIKEREEALNDWDHAFAKTEQTTSSSTDVVIFEKKEAS